MRKKGFRYAVSREAIREHLKLSAKEKLDWLEEANRFSHLAIRGRRRKLWEAFRRGEI